jgi:hypothetical protein
MSDLNLNDSMSMTELHVLELSVIEGVPALTKRWTRPVERDMQGSDIEVFLEGAFVGYVQIVDSRSFVGHGIERAPLA